MKLTHPESKQIVDVTEDAAEAYLSSGWTVKGEKKPE